jgi:hypothetical protein
MNNGSSRMIADPDTATSNTRFKANVNGEGLVAARQ